MARYKDYIQDDERPFGTGTFQLDDGSEFYLDDPERARTVLEELYGGAPNPADQIMAESTNIAERGSADRQGEELGKREQLQNAVAKLAGVPEPNQPFRGIDTGPEPMRRALAGPGTGIDDERARELGAELDQAGGAPPDPATVAQARAGAPPAPSEEERQALEVGERLRRANALVPRGGGPAAGTRVDTSYSRKGGLPEDVYNQQAQDRLGAYGATNEAIGRHYRENAAAADLQAQQLEAQAIAQRQANDKAALELQRKEQKYLDDRAWLEKDVDDFHDKSKPDSGRWFKDGGVLRQLGTAIAQFMGAYASVISGSPNFANAIIDKKIERDIDDQIQAFRQGKMKRDGQLQRMAERGMGVEQMRSGLRLQQEKVIQKELQAAALREGTREAKQAAEAMLLGRQEKFVAEENKFRTEAMGEETVSGTVARGGGGKSLLERLRESNAIEHELRGGDQAVRREEIAGKRADAQNDRVAKYAAANEKTAGLESVEHAVARLEEIDRTNGGFPGVGGGDLGGIPGTDRARLAEEVDQLRTTLSNAIINATPGSKSDSDAIRIAKEAFGEGSEAALRRGMAAMRSLARSQRATIEASADPDAAAEFQRRRDTSLIDQAKRARDERKAREDEEKRKRGGR